MNLLATSALVDSGAIVHLERGNSYLRVNNEQGRGTRIPIEEEDGLYVLRLEHLVPVETIRKTYQEERKHSNFCSHASTQLLAAVMAMGTVQTQHAQAAPANTMDLWHRRLNHTRPETLRVMYDRGVAEGWKLPGGRYNHGRNCNCDACRIARATLSSTPNQRRFDSRYTRPYAVTQTDVPPVFGGYKFSITFICERCKNAYTYLMKKKNEASAKLEEFLNDIRLDGYAPPKEIRTDARSGPTTFPPPPSQPVNQSSCPNSPRSANARASGTGSHLPTSPH